MEAELRVIVVLKNDLIHAVLWGVIVRFSYVALKVLLEQIGGSINFAIHKEAKGFTATALCPFLAILNDNNENDCTVLDSNCTV